MRIDKNSVYVLLTLVIIVAFLLRLATAFWLGEEVVPVSGAYDQISYDAMAQNVLQGKGFSLPWDGYPFTKADEPTAHWSFLYSLYLVGVYGVFGHHPLIARVIQVALSMLALLMVFDLGKRIFDEWVGLAAAAAAALYAYLIFFNATLMTQSFYIISVLAVLEIGLALVRKPTYSRWFLLGLGLGLGTLLRQTMLLFAPLLFVWLWWQMRSQVPQSSPVVLTPATPTPGPAQRHPFFLKGILISVAVMIALILPWTVRNYLTFHDFLLLNSNGGYWLYASNHPGQGYDFSYFFAPPIPDELLNLKEPAIDRALFQQGLGFILADPRRFLILSISRLKDYYWVLPSEQSSSLANIARLGSFAIYLPFMLYGLWLSRHKWRLCLPLYLYIAYDSLFSLMTWATPRYRLASDVILMVFVGLAVTTLATQIKNHLPMMARTNSRWKDSVG